MRGMTLRRACRRLQAGVSVPSDRSRRIAASSPPRSTAAHSWPAVSPGGISRPAGSAKPRRTAATSSSASRTTGSDGTACNAGSSTSPRFSLVIERGFAASSKTERPDGRSHQRRHDGRGAQGFRQIASQRANIRARAAANVQHDARIFVFGDAQFVNLDRPRREIDGSPGPRQLISSPPGDFHGRKSRRPLLNFSDQRRRRALEIGHAGNRRIDELFRRRFRYRRTGCGGRAETWPNIAWAFAARSRSAAWPNRWRRPAHPRRSDPTCPHGQSYPAAPAA